MGRTPENHIQIASPGASRTHAVIEAGPTGFLLSDLGSQNGTYVNGEKITTPHELVDGDRIRIGNAQFVFRSS
jgi:pSer/pThr/pTyr-binding forkhead associated (FHA) protein